MNNPQTIITNYALLFLLQLLPLFPLQSIHLYLLIIISIIEVLKLFSRPFILIKIFDEIVPTKFFS